MQDMKMQNKKNIGNSCTFRKCVTGNTGIRCRAANRDENTRKVRITGNFSRKFSLLSFSNHIAAIFSHTTFPILSGTQIHWHASTIQCHTSMAKCVAGWRSSARLAETRHRAAVAEEAELGRCWHGELPSGVKTDVRLQSNRTSCGQSVERIPRRQRSFAALVSLLEEAFNGTGHATCLVPGHTYWQTPGHSTWPSWPVGGVRLCRLCRPWHSTAATSDRSWHVGRCAGVDSGILDLCRTQQVSFKVSFNGQLFSKQSLLFGVPQGSVLGSLLYLLYTVELEQLILRHGLHSAHPPVWRRQTSLNQRYCQRCTGSRSQAHIFACLRPWRQWVDENQQTAAEPDQDAGNVALLRPAAEASWHQRHLGVVDHRTDHRGSTARK